MHSFINFIVALALGLLSVLVIQDIYTWFLVPLGAPLLTFWHVYGLMVFKALMFYSLRETKETTPTQDTLKIFQIFVMLMISWATGGFASWMMTPA